MITTAEVRKRIQEKHPGELPAWVAAWGTMSEATEASAEGYEPDDWDYELRSTRLEARSVLVEIFGEIPDDSVVLWVYPR